MKLSIGFDVSKSTVDAALFDGIRTEHFQVENSEEGFKMVLEKAGGYALEDIMVTMEATGVYHHRCASFFDSRGFFVSVVNPLIIKRYTDMRMSRVKTDKADAKQIARYGWSQQAYRYKAPSEKCQKIRAFLKVIEGLKREKTQHRNRLEALAQFASDMSEIAAVHHSIIQNLDAQIRQAEQRIQILAQEEHPEKYAQLQTIPGVGKRVAGAVIGYFGSMGDFETAKQLVCFIGSNPSPKESGSSVKGRGSISRKGNSYLRKLFFLAALSACKWNRSCKDLYERLVAKGKAKKVALIAVANKLIRQVFAVTKYSRGYDPEFCAKS